MKVIKKIVLTGGPAGGKTTLTSRLVKELSSIGYRVFIVPEAATELISGFGIKPFGNCLSMFDFQYFVVSSQLHKEKMAWEAAQLVPEDKIVILCDRGVMDDRAYVSQKEFSQVIARFDLISIWYPRRRGRSLPIITTMPRDTRPWNRRGRRKTRRCSAGAATSTAL